MEKTSSGCTISQYFPKGLPRAVFPWPAPCSRGRQVGIAKELPRGHLYLYHLCHVALGARVVGLVLHPHQHDEVQVVPHVVLVFDVLLKGHGLVVKLVPFQPWEKQGRVEEGREEMGRGGGK